MPVTTLLVEGELDAQILQPFFAGQPVLEAAKASKNALAPRARTERQKGLTGTCYLRDRDFDYLPPDDTAKPPVDKEEDGSILGWRWARHEIENYMLEPALVENCLGITDDSYRHEVSEAAKRISHYEAARWTIGQARSELPPIVKFQTRPDDSGRKEFYVPENLDKASMAEWATRHAAAFLEKVSQRLDKEFVKNTFGEFTERFADGLLDDSRNVLLWFSGKDLMAAISQWFEDNGIGSPREFRSRMRNWMSENTQVVLTEFPEWRKLMEAVRQ
ncbi:MAG: hypothetical protein KJ052_18810 [Candidatus Hydrogenedentes bacterium]|nr:hypothetical protein [Candidatus Hydrogenedentota bacterium]